MRILIVEDDDSIAAGLKTALIRANHQAERVNNGLDAELFLRTDHFDLVVLDLGLPGLDGLQLLERFRRSGAKTSVLILSARDATVDRIRGLDLGADDYLTKPFEVDELLARIRALERRRANQAHNVIAHGALALDLSAMTVTLNQQPVDLPRREWMLLRLLLENPSRVFSRGQIEEAIYSMGEGCESNAVDVHVFHLRRKLGSDAIHTVRGVGYRLGVV
jgi:two-component system, OmpR family, response regulator QseB